MAQKFYYCPTCGEELDVCWTEEVNGYIEDVCTCTNARCVCGDWKITTDPWFGQIVKIEKFYFG